MQDVSERETAADRRNAVTLDECHERRFLAAHDVERMVGAALVLPHEHRRDRPRVAVDGHDRRVLAADGDGCDVAGAFADCPADCVHEDLPHRLAVLLGVRAGAIDRQRSLRPADDLPVVGDDCHLQVGRPDIDPDSECHPADSGRFGARGDSSTL